MKNPGFAYYQSKAVQCLVLLPVVFALCGCGSDDIGRVEVSGKVTIGDSPVKAGRVNFIPEGETKGPASGGQIDAGFFLISQDRGPVPGKYLVRVQVDSNSQKQNETRPPSKDEVLSGTREVSPEVGSEGDDLMPETEDTGPSLPEFHVTVSVEGPNSFTLKIDSE
jgi:hypothetical protein